MRAVGLDYPVYLTVPVKGTTLVSIIAPVDPIEEQWHKATQHLSCILEERFVGTRLSG